MHRLLAFTVLAALPTLVCLPAQAQLLRSSVTGSLQAGNSTLNDFDPANRYVPTGYTNFTSGPTVIIADPAVEFGFDDGWVKQTADFTGNQLIIQDNLRRALLLSPYTMTFTSDAFSGLELTKVSDSHVVHDLSAVLVGNTITVSWVGAAVPAGGYTGVFNLSSPANSVPEPGTIALLGVALPITLLRSVRIGLIKRRKA